MSPPRPASYRAEWCIKGTLVTLPPPLKEPWPLWLVDRRCTPIACPMFLNIHSPYRPRPETIYRGVTVRTSDSFNSFKNIMFEILPDRILVLTVPSMPVLSFRDPGDIGYILSAYSKILRVLLLT